MQNVNFDTVNAFLDFLPEDELKLVLFLRQLVFDCVPNVTEKLAYNVPFFKRHKNICFIWPSSVFWGKQKTYEGVRFGFTNGYLLSDEFNCLKKESRKQVYWIDYTNLNQIDVDVLKGFLYEAVLIDDSERLNKHKM